jgi:hypothetical protein
MRYSISLFLLFIVAPVAMASPVLIAVELPTMESKKSWHRLNISTYELIGNTAIAQTDESLIEQLKQRGYQINVIDQQPDLLKYVIVSEQDNNQAIMGKSIWQNGKTAILKPALASSYFDREYKHIIRAMNTKPLGERFWKSVTTKYVVLKTIPYDPFIQILVDQVNADSIASYIQRLQDFKTRFSLTDSSYAASQWLAEKVSDWGYVAEFDSFYMKTKYWSNLVDSNLVIDSGYARNVIATKESMVYSKSISIISGHYDATLNWDSITVKELNCPGADDNASGVAGAMEVARILSGNAWNYTLEFCGWAAEEQGVLGSNCYAQYADSSNMDIMCMSNMDMIGFRCDSIHDGGLASKKQWLLDIAMQLIPLYVADYQPVYYYGEGCDDGPFAQLGYPNLYCHEDYYEFTTSNPNVHSLTDSLKTLTTEIYVKNVKAMLALISTMLLYPKVVEPFVYDMGNGNSLLLTWTPNKDDGTDGYYVYWGETSEVYTDSVYIGGKDVASDTIDGLLTDSTYYFIIRAVALDGKHSLEAIEKSGVPRSVPVVPVIKAVPIVNGITCTWNKNNEIDLVGYMICRSIDSCFNYETVDTLGVADTVYIDQPLSGANKYYYKVRSFDGDGNYSSFSDSVYGRPITLDQGVLVVDETYWSSGLYPNDAKQDSFYNYIMAGYKVTEYEYDSIQHKPILADFGPYSVVVWHGDDNNSLWASYAMNDLRSYFDAGGKVWFVGWKPSGNVRNNAAYPADFGGGSMMYDEFLVSHAELSGSADSFKAATGLKGYPDLNIDTMKYPATIFGKTFRSIEALTPTGTGDTIYVMDMKNNSSLFEGRACAVRDSGKAVFFGFPMYFMDREQAKLAAGKVLEEFGEEPVGITGKPDSRELIRETGLFQNAPNPFIQKTVISYQLSKSAHVSLKIYNIQGQLVKTLIDEERQAGSYAVKWDRNDSQNRQVSAGVYIYQISINGMTQSRKMIVMK